MDSFMREDFRIKIFLDSLKKNFKEVNIDIIERRDGVLNVKMKKLI